MVAIIKTGHSINRILNYNENKVKEGVAEIISAVNYPIDIEKLTFINKLKRLQNQVALNENVSRKSVHISLNFDPTEHLSKERLGEIASTYMRKIGFDQQPYLVYQHFDSGHPHIHIVSIKVRADGSRIDTQNIGRNQSEKARKEIEQAFGLKRAEDSRLLQQSYRLKPVAIQKLQYGRSAPKRAITNILDAILKDYKYTNLAELNAILKQYNVMADRSNESSRIFQNHGLVYRILDEQGYKVGVPIKASDFYNKPTLSYLEKQFVPNETARQPHKSRIKNAIDLALLKQPNQSLQALMKTLEKDGINTVLRQNEDGIIYGITYVDHRTKCVFNGSMLGKQYSAKGMLERCGESQKQPAQNQEFLQQSNCQPAFAFEQVDIKSGAQNKEGINLLETLLQPEHTSGYAPSGLPGKGRKKKKKRISKRL
ncbi:MAG: relaxase/mobilization nuclease domain-containing protein [Bacteroidota bacterium]